MAWSRWTSGWLKSVTVPLDAALRKVLADDSPHTANVSEETWIRGNIRDQTSTWKAWTTRRNEELDGCRLTVNEDKLAAYPHEELPPCRSALDVPLNARSPANTSKKLSQRQKCRNDGRASLHGLVPATCNPLFAEDYDRNGLRRSHERQDSAHRNPHSDEPNGQEERITDTLRDLATYSTLLKIYLDSEKG